MSTELHITTREQLERHLLDTIKLADNPQTPAKLAKLAQQRAIALTYRLSDFNQSSDQQTKVFKVA